MWSIIKNLMNMVTGISENSMSEHKEYQMNTNIESNIINMKIPKYNNLNTKKPPNLRKVS